MVLRTIYFHLLNLVCCMEKLHAVLYEKDQFLQYDFEFFFEVLTR